MEATYTHSLSLSHSHTLTHTHAHLPATHAKRATTHTVAAIALAKYFRQLSRDRPPVEAWWQLVSKCAEASTKGGVSKVTNLRYSKGFVNDLSKISLYQYNLLNVPSRIPLITLCLRPCPACVIYVAILFLSSSWFWFMSSTWSAEYEINRSIWGCRHLQIEIVTWSFIDKAARHRQPCVLRKEHKGNSGN